MARVSVAEGISYGVGLFGYMLGIVVFGLLFQILGIGIIVSERYAIGAIVFLIGGVATYSGVAGTTYKVIADAVHKGTQGPDTGGTATKIADSADGTARKVADDADTTTGDRVADSSEGAHAARKVPDDNGSSTDTTADGESR